jgi:competence protein ComEC
MLAERARVPRRDLRAGARLEIGEAVITVLGPDDTIAASRNDDSLVLRLDWRGVSVLLTGDLGWDGENRLLARGEPLHALVLKVGHHGSRFSSSAEFLRAVRPTVAVVSAGRRNPFGHPSPATIDRLHAAGARVYRTDRDGAVILETDGETLQITRWASRQVDLLRPHGHAVAKTR